MPSHTSDGFEAWKNNVNQVMKENYCIDISDAGIDDDQLNSHQNMLPEEFVEWFGRKYDLISIDRVLTLKHATSMKS